MAVVAQIEDAAAMTEIGAIAAVDGIDCPLVVCLGTGADLRAASRAWDVSVARWVHSRSRRTGATRSIGSMRLALCRWSSESRAWRRDVRDDGRAAHSSRRSRAQGAVGRASAQRDRRSPRIDAIRDRRIEALVVSIERVQAGEPTLTEDEVAREPAERRVGRRALAPLGD